MSARAIISIGRESALSGLGVAASYAIPWIVFFSNCFFPEEIPVDTVFFLWMAHLLVVGATTIALFGVFKAGEFLRVFQVSSAVYSAIGIAASMVALAVLCRIMASKPVILAMVCLFSLFYGHMLYLLSYQVSQTSVHIASVVVPMSLFVAGIFYLVAVALENALACLMAATVFPALVWKATVDPRDMSDETAQLVGNFAKHMTNDIIFDTKNRRPVLVMLTVGAFVVSAEVFNMLRVGLPGMTGGAFFVAIFAVAGGALFAVVSFVGKDLSLLMLSFVVSLCSASSFILVNVDFSALRYFGGVLALFSWAFMENYYWIILVGRSGVDTSGGALLIYGRTRSFLQVALFCGSATGFVLFVVGAGVPGSFISICVSVALVCMLLASVFNVSHRVTTNLVESSLTAKQDAADSFLSKVERFCDTSMEKYCLTKREREILEYMLLGKPAANIASSLFISVNTVKGHISHIYSKIGVRKKSDLIALYDKTIEGDSAPGQV